MNLKQISMRQIDYFLAVARHLSFTEAAQSLYISQPSISKQIAQFEHEIGVGLFMRTKRAVRLTPAGTILLKELSDIQERIDTAIAKARQPNLGEEGELRIGCLDAIDTALFLRKAINDFKSAYPGIRLSIERHSFRALREKLIAGGLDLIFTLSFEIDASLDLLHDTIHKASGCIVMASNHPLASRDRLELYDLRDENFVLISREESPNAFDGVIALCRKHGFTPRIVKQLPNVESLLLSVESGLGVSIFESSIRLFHNENFKFFEVENDVVSVVMAYKKGNYNPAVSLFANTVLQRAKEGAES